MIPTLNRAALVARALDSALAQTAAGIEIIVSDNGSSDNTPAVLARYAEREHALAPSLRLMRHAQTMPADEHGNFLVAQCRGEYFLGLSDDDHLEPQFAERVLALLDERPGLAFVYTGCWVYYGDVPVPALTGPRVERGDAFLAAFYAGRREVCWCACVTRLADLRAIGPIPRGRIFGDMFYWTQLALADARRNGSAGVGCVAAPLAHYTLMSSDNLSTGVPVRPWAAETRLLADSVIDGLAQNAFERLPALRVDAKRFVARSTANQFVWRLLRGAPRRGVAGEALGALRYLAGDLTVWPRVLAALLLPAWVLRRLVLSAAARRARQRGGGTASAA